MNISLTPELESFINEKVGTGLYHSASEVIRDGLRLLREREFRHQVDRLNREVDLGLSSLAQGKHSPGSEVHQRMKKRSEDYKKVKK